MTTQLTFSTGNNYPLFLLEHTHPYLHIAKTSNTAATAPYLSQYIHT